MSKIGKPEKEFDLRTLEFKLGKGIVSQKAYDAYLNKLPDDSDNYEEVLLQEEDFGSQDESAEDATNDIGKAIL